MSCFSIWDMRVSIQPVCAFSQGREVIHEDLLRHLGLTQLHYCVWRSQHCPTLTDKHTTHTQGEYVTKSDTCSKTRWRKSLMWDWYHSYCVWGRKSTCLRITWPSSSKLYLYQFNHSAPWSQSSSFRQVENLPSQMNDLKEAIGQFSAFFFSIC